ncbi:Ternary complex factor MIP1, leucine-zipper [Salix suchowensis]|nr:Ternary complex factor MIP1, leucine-zipper [Salix suchowensis]
MFLPSRSQGAWGILECAKPSDRRMCDSPVMLSQSDSTSKILYSKVIYGNSKTQLDLADEESTSSSLEANNVNEEAGSFASCIRSSNPYPYRIQLEQDVWRLQQQLQEEMEMHAILENAIEKNTVKLSCPSCLPRHFEQAQELLSTIAVMEVTVSKLEQEIVSLHFQLSQERNERRLAEYRLRQSASQSLSAYSFDSMKEEISSSSRSLKHSDCEQHQSEKNNSHKHQTSESTGETSSAQSLMEDSLKAPELFHEKRVSVQTDAKPTQPAEFMRLSKGMPPKGLWDYPNQLSEEMVKCMKNIFMSLADSAAPSASSALESQSSPVSPRGHLSSSSWWSSSERSVISSWVQSPQIDIKGNSEVLALDSVFDPYKVHGKLSWADIGNYGLATEVSWMSVGKKQLEYASGALRKFRTLVEQLAKVNPIHLSCNEKLAFWINLYNALIMHAYLAYGVPRSDLKLFSLMQKAAYTVGGHYFSAAAIEYVILKMKPPLHRPQIALLLALHKLRLSEEQQKSVIDAHEPLVAFALSCGMYSSPAVRVFTAKNVREELKEAQHDFIRASAGVSNKGKLLVPKMLHCFAKGSVDDTNLAVWISHYLPPNQAAFVEQCISQRRQSLLGSRNCGILPFDSRFRYLFLPDKTSL